MFFRVVVLCAGALCARAALAQPGTYQTGFEPGEGFSTGYVEQNGWTGFVNTPPSTEGRIASSNPAAGTQHLRISKQLDLPQFRFTGGFSPDTGPQTGGSAFVELDVNISATGGAEYNVSVQSPTRGIVTAQVSFYFDDQDGDGVPGDILVREGFMFIPTGAEYTPGQYRPLRIEIYPSASQIRYFYGGALIFSGPVWSGTTTDQVVILSDNFQAPGETGDFDNLRTGSIPTDPCAGIERADSDGDGAVNFNDIDCFITALIDEGAWRACGSAHPASAFRCANDANSDGAVDFDDIDAFIVCLINGGCEL